MKKNIIMSMVLTLSVQQCALADGPAWRKGYPYNKQEMIQQLKATNFDTFLRLADWSLAGYAFYQATCFAVDAFNRLTQSELKILHNLSAEKVIFAPLSAESQKKLAQLTVDDFTRLIEAKLVSLSEQQLQHAREKIVTQYNLYQFPAFIAAISSWPEFTQRIAVLAQAFEKSDEQPSSFANLQGFEKDAFVDFVKTYHRKIGNQS